jgi:hypothetical protein
MWREIEFHRELRHMAAGQVLAELEVFSALREELIDLRGLCACVV